MKRFAGHLLRFSFGVGLIVLAFIVLDVHPAKILSDLGQIDAVKLAALILPVFALDRILMTYKWGLLLRAAGVRLPFWELFNVYMVSGFVGAFLPTSIGADLSRFYHLHKKRLDSADVAASIVMERLFGFFAVLTWATVTVPVLAWLHPESMALLLFVGSLIIALPLVALAITNRAILVRVRAVLPRLVGERITAISARLYRSFHAYRRRGRVLVVFFLLSVAETGFAVLGNVILAWMLQIDISLGAIALVVPLALILVRLPISLNGIGVFEWSYVSLYTLIGMTQSQALSLGLLADTVTILFSLSGGLFLLYHLVRWRRSEPRVVSGGE